MTATTRQPHLATGATPASAAVPLQARVHPWLLECFGAEIASDTEERNHRFLEESLELVQACGCTQSEAHQLVDYVYGRPVGEKGQEVGGVMITLAALCLAQHLNMDTCGEVELARIWTKVEQIRAKQAAKPKHSPLPAPQPPASEKSAFKLNPLAKDCAEEVFRIDPIGRIFWKQREVETDDELRTAMLEIRDALVKSVSTPVSEPAQKLSDTEIALIWERIGLPIPFAHVLLPCIVFAKPKLAIGE